ncbi:MAG: hypothetical protein VKK62_09795 [Synechococcaceae cyanobacterium]|nr:hypothetical protein [Synechococcaceae cyanobacterium]
MPLLALTWLGGAIPAVQAAGLPPAGRCLETQVRKRTYEPLPPSGQAGRPQTVGLPDRLVVLTLENGVVLEGIVYGHDTTFYGNFASGHRVSLCLTTRKGQWLTLADLVTGASLTGRPRPAATATPGGRPAVSPAPRPAGKPGSAPPAATPTTR